jgi:hypothetical protein
LVVFSPPQSNSQETDITVAGSKNPEPIFDDLPLLPQQWGAAAVFRHCGGGGNDPHLINQGDALFGEHPLKLTKLLLTYLVPYCVATYGALSYQLAQNRPSKTPPSVARTSKTAPGKSPRLI